MLKPEKVIVPEAVKSVKPETAPAEVTFQLVVLTAAVPEPPPIVTCPVVVPVPMPVVLVPAVSLSNSDAPLTAPLLLMLKTVESLIKLVNVPEKVMPLVTAPALWVKFKRLVTVPPPVCWIKVLLVSVPVGLLLVNVATVAAEEVAAKVSLVLTGERLPAVLCQ